MGAAQVRSMEEWGWGEHKGGPRMWEAHVVRYVVVRFLHSFLYSIQLTPSTQCQATQRRRLPPNHHLLMTLSHTTPHRQVGWSIAIPHQTPDRQLAAPAPPLSKGMWVGHMHSTGKLGSEKHEGGPRTWEAHPSALRKQTMIIVVVRFPNPSSYPPPTNVYNPTAIVETCR